jgi:tetratricopeptide (TPR) repeat protein
MGFCMLVGYGAWNLLQRASQTSKLLQFSTKFLFSLLILSHSLKTVARNRDWYSGFTVYTSGIQQNPTSGVMLSNLGVEYAMIEDYKTSEMLYRTSMKNAPRYSRAFFNFGKLMKIQNIHDRAEWGFRQAIALGGNDTTDSKQGEAYYHLIDIVALDPARQEEALELSHSALDFANSFSKLYITHSNLLVQMNRTYEALSATEMAASKNPTSSVAHYNLGLVHMKLSQLAQAAVSFRTALSLKQDSIQVMYNLASVLQVTANGHLDTLQEALGLWIKVLTANPHHTDALVNLASLYYELKDFSKTRHTLQQILQQTPNHTDTHYRLAVLEYKQGNYREAMETFSKVSNLQPGYKKTQSYLELTQRELLQQRHL